MNMYTPAHEFANAARTGDLQRLAVAANSPDFNPQHALDRVNGVHSVSALNCAMKDGHSDMVIALIALGTDVDPLRPNVDFSRIPLNFAAGLANPDMVRILLESGASTEIRPRHPGHDGGTPTQLVFRHPNQRTRPRLLGQDHIDTIRLLLRHGVDINAPCVNMRSVSPSSPLRPASRPPPYGTRPDCMSLVEWAVASGSVALVKELVAQGARIHDPDEEGTCGETLVSIAVCNNATIDVLRYLVEELGLKDTIMTGFRALGNQYWPGRTETHPHQPRPVELEMARFLKDNIKDVDPECTFATYNELCETLCMAASRGNTPLVRFLLDAGVFADAVNPFRETALLAACRGNADADLVRLLLERGAKVRYKIGRMPGAQDKFPDYAAFLERFGGNTVLHQAARRSPRYPSPEVIKALLDAGSNTEARNRRGQTPLLVAAAQSWMFRKASLRIKRMGFVECFRLLADSCQDINAADNRGKTAIHLIALDKERHIPVVKLLVEILISKGANLDIRDKKGRTGLFCLKSNCGIDPEDVGSSANAPPVSSTPESGVEMKEANRAGEDGATV